MRTYSTIGNIFENQSLLQMPVESDSGSQAIVHDNSVVLI